LVCQQILNKFKAQQREKYFAKSMHKSALMAGIFALAMPLQSCGGGGGSSAPLPKNLAPSIATPNITASSLE